MAVSQLNLKIRNNVVSITCDEGQKEYIESLAKKLEERINKLSKTLKASELSLAIIAGLNLEAENDELKTNSDKIDPEMLVNTIDMISDYIEKLASKWVVDMHWITRY
jgi:cell division protein ZapA (FtsZ GTPase activity inhibitor)